LRSLRCKCGTKINRSVTGITHTTCAKCREKKASELRRKYDIAVVYVKDLGPSPIRWDGGYKMKENKCQVGSLSFGSSGFNAEERSRV
jgi:hypothetical protein